MATDRLEEMGTAQMPTTGGGSRPTTGGGSRPQVGLICSHDKTPLKYQSWKLEYKAGDKEFSQTEKSLIMKAFSLISHYPEGQKLMLELNEHRDTYTFERVSRTKLGNPAETHTSGWPQAGSWFGSIKTKIADKLFTRAHGHEKTFADVGLASLGKAVAEDHVAYVLFHELLHALNKYRPYLGELSDERLDEYKKPSIEPRERQFVNELDCWDYRMIKGGMNIWYSQKVFKKLQEAGRKKGIRFQLPK